MKTRDTVPESAMKRHKVARGYATVTIITITITTTITITITTTISITITITITITIHHLATRGDTQRFDMLRCNMPQHHVSEAGMIHLETLIELKIENSSLSSL